MVRKGNLLAAPDSSPLGMKINSVGNGSGGSSGLGTDLVALSEQAAHNQDFVSAESSLCVFF
jgi:hypothetical protein